MAIIANARPSPYVVDGATIELMDGIPFGPFMENPELLTEIPPGIVPPVLVNRFPTPPAGKGFMTEPIDPPYVLPPRGLGTPYRLTGAVLPEGTYLEPSRGQIWPRIG